MRTGKFLYVCSLACNIGDKNKAGRGLVHVRDMYAYTYTRREDYLILSLMHNITVCSTCSSYPN